MARTGPQKYPGASTAHYYGARYRGSSMESNVIVWHSTEGTSLPSYRGGADAPNLTAVPDFKARKLRWHQHFDFDVSSRALMNKAGGVETNTLNACQVEIVGTCDPSTHAKWKRAGYPHLYMPDLPDWAVRDLAEFAKWAHDKHGVPLTSAVTFKAYPSSYGHNGVRMPNTKWSNYRGHCGHQHVPENDHGDPGDFPMGAILAAAKGTKPAPAEESTTTTRPSTPKRPTVDLSKLIAAARSNPPAKGTPVTYAGARVVEAALVAEGLLAKKRDDGHFGSDTVAAYARWQRRCGYSGAAADGIPGRASLDALGRKHGFTVTA